MDAEIQAYVRSGVGRETEQVGSFFATFSHRSANPYLNYAIPDAGATPSPTDVAALVAAYRRRERMPRLEYLPSLAPAVEAVLLAAGFVVEGRLPLMVYASGAGAERGQPVPNGIELIAPTSDEEIRAMVTAQNEAYGESAATLAEVAARKANLAAGGFAVLARDMATGEPAGGGICDVPANGTTELAGIGVRAAFRRRGIAGAMTLWLVRAAFTREVTTVFLTPAHEAEERIYARIGFTRVSEQLHISLPRQ